MSERKKTKVMRGGTVVGSWESFDPKRDEKLNRIAEIEVDVTGHQR